MIIAWVVSVEAGLNGHELIERWYTEQPTEAEIASVEGEWGRVTGFGGVRVWQLTGTGMVQEAGPAA